MSEAQLFCGGLALLANLLILAGIKIDERRAEQRRQLEAELLQAQIESERPGYRASLRGACDLESAGGPGQEQPAAVGVRQPMTRGNP